MIGEFFANVRHNGSRAPFFRSRCAGDFYTRRGSSLMSLDARSRDYDLQHSRFHALRSPSRKSPWRSIHSLSILRDVLEKCFRLGGAYYPESDREQIGRQI